MARTRSSPAFFVLCHLRAICTRCDMIRADAFAPVAICRPTQVRAIEKLKPTLASGCILTRKLSWFDGSMDSTSTNKAIPWRIKKHQETLNWTLMALMFFLLPDLLDSFLRPRFQPPDFEGEDGQLPREELGVGTAYNILKHTEKIRRNIHRLLRQSGGTRRLILAKILDMAVIDFHFRSRFPMQHSQGSNTGWLQYPTDGSLALFSQGGDKSRATEHFLKLEVTRPVKLWSTVLSSSTQSTTCSVFSARCFFFELTGGIEWLSGGALCQLLPRAFPWTNWQIPTANQKHPSKYIENLPLVDLTIIQKKLPRRMWQLVTVAFPQDLGPFPAMTFVEYKSRSSNQWILAKAWWDLSSMTFLSRNGGTLYPWRVLFHGKSSSISDLNGLIHIGSVGKCTGSPHLIWWSQPTMIPTIHTWSLVILLWAFLKSADFNFFLVGLTIAGWELQRGHPKLSVGCSALCTSRQAGDVAPTLTKKADLTSESQPAQKRHMRALLVLKPEWMSEHVFTTSILVLTSSGVFNMWNNADARSIPSSSEQSKCLLLAGYALAVQPRGDPFRRALSAQCFNIFVLQPNKLLNHSVSQGALRQKQKQEMELQCF